MAYQDCRDHIKTVLGSISITSPPADASIVRVYEEMPETLEDTPCFIMVGSSGSTGWSVGGGSTAGMEEHTERCGLLVHDADYAQASAVLRAFWVATIAAFQDDSGLGGHGQVSAFRWEEPESVLYAGKSYVGQDFLITFAVKVTT